MTLSSESIANPGGLILDRLGYGIVPSVSYDVTAKDLWSLTLAIWSRAIYRKAAPYLVRLLRYYAHARCLGLDLSEFPLKPPPDDPEKVGQYLDTLFETETPPLSPYTWLFNSMWHWRWVELMPKRTVQSIGEIVAAIHLHVLRKRRVCYRPEFAFVSGWTGSLRWAWPYRELYIGARHGMDELHELANKNPVEKIVPIFFGIGSRRAGTWADWRGDSPDDKSVESQVGLDLQTTYGALIQPKEERLRRELIDFVSAE